MGTYYKGQRYGEFYENPDKNLVKFCESKKRYDSAFRYLTEGEISIPVFRQPSSLNSYSANYMCDGSGALVSFNPNFDFSMLTAMVNAFSGCSKLETIPNPINVARSTHVAGMFQDCRKLKEIHVVNSDKVTNFEGFVRGCYKLEKLDIIDGTACTNFIRFFYMENYPYLTHFRAVPNTIHVSFSFEHCPALDADSIQSIVDGLAEVTSAQTVTFNNAITISAQQQQDIADKGWTLAFA